MSDQTATLPRPMLTGVGNFYVTGEDWLRVTAWNSEPGAVLTISGRFLGVSAPRPSPFAHTLTPATDRTASSRDFPLEEGWIQNVTVTASSGTPAIGQSFARVDVIRGRNAAAVVVGTLLQGYVVSAQALAWPGSPLTTSPEGRGFVQRVAGADPAAGVDWSVTVPAFARWRVLSAIATLVTDATADTREIDLVIDDGATILARAPAGATQGASLSLSHGWWRTTERLAQVGTTVTVAPLPDLILPAGYRVRSITTDLAAGDNWSAPQLLVEEWLEIE